MLYEVADPSQNQYFDILGFLHSLYKNFVVVVWEISLLVAA